MIFCLYCKWEF